MARNSRSRLQTRLQLATRMPHPLAPAPLRKPTGRGGRGGRCGGGGEPPGERRKRGERCGGGAWFATGRRGVRAPYCGRRGDGARRPAAERAGPIHSENRQQGRRAVRQAIGAGVCNSETARREATGPERPSTAPPYPALRSTRALRCSRKRSEHSGRPKRPPSNAMKHPPPPPGGRQDPARRETDTPSQVSGQFHYVLRC